MIIVMTPEHSKWREFADALEGPEGCDFKESELGDITWHCEGGNDKSLSIKLLNKMGFKPRQIEHSLEYFDSHGGHCDCEVLFNVDE